MAADSAKKPGSVKSMSNVIAQLEKGKGNTGLRPTAPGSQKPVPQIGVKPSTLASAKGNLRKSVSEKEDDCPATPATATKPEEAANPFKVALKPVKPSTACKPSNDTEKNAKPSGVSKSEVPGSGEPSVSNKSKLFDKPAIKAEPAGAKDVGDPDGSGSSSSLVSNRSKMFENSQRKSEADSPNISSNTEPSLKSKPYDNATLPKANLAPKPASKSPFVAGTTQNSSNVGGTLAERGKKSYGKSDEKENVHTTQNNSAQETTKPRGKAFVAELENKVFQQHLANSHERLGSSSTLPKKTKESPQISQTTNYADDKEENNEEEEETEKPKVPSRVLEKVEKQKPKTKMVPVTSEESDQPKIPPRKDQKAQETKTASPKPSNAIDQKTSQTSQSKNQEKFNQNTNKTGTDNLQSLLRNKDRATPSQSRQKENQKKYRLLPVPKPSGNPPRKLAKPPVIDLNKYAKSKGVVIQNTPKSSSSAAPSYDDGDDIYEDCDDIPAVQQIQQTSRISEYTEEEEAAELEKMAKGKLGQAPDNYGKMFNNNPQDYEDDEIYQEID